MVVIVNGEVVPDNDPRALRMRKQQQHTSPTPPPTSIQGLSTPPSNSTSTTSQWQQMLTRNYLTEDVARMLGIQNRNIRIPAFSFLHKDSFDFPLIYAIILAVAVICFGAISLLFVGLVYVIFAPSQQQQQQQGRRRGQSEQ
eukprot:GHVS01033768.1.p1 GENE.GHVS01033768.1~~GHVS01033768.1.p1  ORF type:complete len:142 (-),score=33.55 GHVS01033768.1:116-541(-)